MSTSFARDGYKVTNSGKKMRFRCTHCGKIYNSRIEEISSKIRAGLFG